MLLYMLTISSIFNDSNLLVLIVRAYKDYSVGGNKRFGPLRGHI